jgi:hypothetical protein
VNESPRARRLEEVPQSTDAERANTIDRILATANQLPRPLTYGVSTLGVLLAADALGVRLSFVSSVLADPYVFFFLRLLVILVLGVLMGVALWLGCSVASHVANRRWIRRIAGFEPQALYRGAGEVEAGYEQLKRVTREILDRNAQLVVNLEHTDARNRQLEQEVTRLRRVLGHQQLELGDDR